MSIGVSLFHLFCVGYLDVIMLCPSQIVPPFSSRLLIPIENYQQGGVHICNFTIFGHMEQTLLILIDYSLSKLFKINVFKQLGLIRTLKLSSFQLE